MSRITFYLNRRDDVRAGLRMAPERQRLFWANIRRRGYILVYDHYNKRNSHLPVRHSDSVDFVTFVRGIPNAFVWTDRRAIYRAFLTGRLYGKDSIRNRFRLQRLEKLTSTLRRIRRRTPELGLDTLDRLGLSPNFNHRWRYMDPALFG